jgi:hypothetical protein
MSLRADIDSRVTSSPATRALPRDGVTTPHIMEMAVVLPAPLGPSRPKISPCSISRSSPESAQSEP